MLKMNTTKAHGYKWIPLLGKFEETTNGLTFKGQELPSPPSNASEKQPLPSSPRRKTKAKPEEQIIAPRVMMGQAICDQRFTEGRISAQIEFDEVDYRSMADILIQYDPASEELLSVSLGGGGTSFVSLRLWTTIQNEANQTPNQRAPKAWKYLRSGGERANLSAKRPYNLEILVRGSAITLIIDGVEIATEVLPFQLPGKQVGVFAAGHKDIHFRNFIVEPIRPQVFVVMQFNTPAYDALFNDVITPVCEEVGLRVFRADFTHLPGIVISDLTKQIAESRVVIAEITPVNGNVYYEVGYADALRKPLILIADKTVEALPFDVRPYRTIFYENSIGGKNKVQETLTKFLKNIMSSQPLSEY